MKIITAKLLALPNTDAKGGEVHFEHDDVREWQEQFLTGNMTNLTKRRIDALLTAVCQELSLTR